MLKYLLSRLRFQFYNLYSTYCLYEKVLPKVVVDGNILLTLKRRNANWIGHIWSRNRLLKHVIEGKIEGKMDVMVRGGRRRKQLLDDLDKNIGC